MNSNIQDRAELEKVQHILSLLAEYSSKLRNSVEKWSDIRHRLLMFAGLMISLFFIALFSMIEIVPYRYSQQVGMSVIMIFFVTCLFVFLPMYRKMVKVKLDINEFSHLVIRLLRRVSKLEEFSQHNLTSDIEFDLRLAEAELAISYSKRVIGEDALSEY